VLFDLDGTLNVGDEQMVEQMTLDAVWAARLFDARAQKGAASVCRAWAARGYQCIYLSGRQGGFYQHTRRWLVAHGFPAGPIALTEFQLLAALPGKARTNGASQSRAQRMRHTASVTSPHPHRARCWASSSWWAPSSAATWTGCCARASPSAPRTATP
jgi:hypothetical protein